MKLGELVRHKDKRNRPGRTLGIIISASWLEIPADPTSDNWRCTVLWNSGLLITEDAFYLEHAK